MDILLAMPVMNASESNMLGPGGHLVSSNQITQEQNYIKEFGFYPQGCASH